MNVSLTHQLEQLVSKLVESSRYRSASEVVREGLRLLAVRDEADRAKLEALRRMIQEGIDSGPAAPLDMDEIIATARGERYLRRLDDAIHALARNPLMGRARPELGEAIRSLAERQVQRAVAGTPFAPISLPSPKLINH